MMKPTKDEWINGNCFASALDIWVWEVAKVHQESQKQAD